MIDNDLYDRSGEPIDFWKWAMLFEDKRYQVLRQTHVGGLLISTVWTGIDHELADEPFIFETMIFGTSVEEGYRYSTEQAALDHHDELVAQATLLLAAETSN